MVNAQLLAVGIRKADSRKLYPDRHQADEAGLPLLVVENTLGRAVIALQGAHIMSFQPAGKDDLLWLSPLTRLSDGVPIRGGIPLCLPWFGPGPDGKSMHGFARTSDWTVTAGELLPNDTTRLVLELAGDASTSELWPHAFVFRLELEIGSTLKMTLEVNNHGIDSAPLAFAFHTYFSVPDVAKARVSGLDGTVYVDKIEAFSRKTQTGEVTIDGATDRIYLDVPKRQTITAGARHLTIESEARCAVVWNAWDNDKNIPDLGAGNHVGYLCVERGDVADYAATLAPGGSYRVSMTLEEE